jgi:polyhydroxybutyrate depolymerase
MRRLILMVLVVLLLTFYGTSQAQTGTELHTMTYDGHERSYYVYTPVTEATRLMILLHPSASSGLAMELETGFNAIADEAGYVVVYPNTLNAVWDDGRLAAGLNPTGESVDDVGFLATLAETIATEHNIDSSQIYLAGVGNGAVMAMTAACETPEVYAGIGVVSALIWDYQLENCGNAESETAVNMIFIYGSRDPLYLPAGNPLTDLDGNVLFNISGAADTADFWLNFNGCDPAVYQAFDVSTLTIFEECNNDTRFAWVSVLGGSSTWLRSDRRVNGHLGIDTSEILHAFFSGADNLLETTIQETVPEDGSLSRSWLLYVPSTYDASNPTPLVVGLHGRFANALSQAYASDFNAIAEREGIIVVYPNALNSDLDANQTEWNYGRDIPRYTPPPQNDEQFISDLIDDLDEVLNIDRNRMYLTGLSNGGIMTQRMACTERDMFAAYASVAATAPFGLPIICEGQSPAPMLFYVGTDDVMWTGQLSQDATGNDYYVVAPMDATAAFWATHNNCSTTFESADLPGTDVDSSVRLMVFDDCPNNAAVVVFGVIGGGHVWPGIREYETSMGEINMDYNASEIIWDFFAQYTLEGHVGDTTLGINDIAPVDLATIPVEPTATPQPTAEASTTENTDTANPEETGEAFVINQLQQGGYVIYIRHTATDRSQEDTSLDSCETQRNLNDLGIVQAQSIGRAFEIMEIPVGQVYSTGYCRTDDTATLAFGETEVREDFFDFGVLLEMLSEPPEEGTNTIIVGHAEILLQYTSIEVEEGDSVIFQPMGNGNFRPLTIISAISWVNLAAYYTENMQSE